MTRIEIPIPEPEQPELAFEFVDRDDGLVEFRAETTEDHIAAFRKVGTGIDTGFWAQGAVVASLTKKYGQVGPEIEKLAAAVERSASHLRHMALTYRTFTTTHRWVPDLTFKHHMVACAYKDPTEALNFALEGNIPCAVLQEWVAQRNQSSGKRATRKAKRAVKTAFLEHLEHVESIIETDFIRNCPSKDFAHRVYNEWLSEIKFELRQFNRQVNEDLVRAAMEDAGAATLAEIRTATELPMSDVEAVVGSMVAKGEYEWIPKRGEGEVTRGTHSMMLHKVGTSDGGAFIGARPESRYSN